MTVPTEPARAAAYRAIVRRATQVSEVWGSRVYPDIAPAGVSRPYIVYFWSGGGEMNRRTIVDADLLIGIKGVSDTFAESLAIAGRISVLFNDADLGTALLSPGAQWYILSCTQGRDIHLVETVDGRQLTHEGAYFRFELESVQS